MTTPRKVIIGPLANGLLLTSLLALEGQKMEVKESSENIPPLKSTEDYLEEIKNSDFFKTTSNRAARRAENKRRK